MKHLTRLIIVAALALAFASSTTRAQEQCMAPNHNIVLDGVCSCAPGETQGPPCRMAQISADVVANVEGSIV